VVPTGSEVRPSSNIRCLEVREEGSVSRTFDEFPWNAWGPSTIADRTVFAQVCSKSRDCFGNQYEERELISNTVFASDRLKMILINVWTMDQSANPGSERWKTRWVFIPG